MGLDVLLPAKIVKVRVGVVLCDVDGRQRHVSALSRKRPHHFGLLRKARLGEMESGQQQEKNRTVHMSGPFQSITRWFPISVTEQARYLFYCLIAGVAYSFQVR